MKKKNEEEKKNEGDDKQVLRFLILLETSVTFPLVSKGIHLRLDFSSHLCIFIRNLYDLEAHQ